MPDWSKFTDSDIALIKRKMNHKFEKVLVVTFLLSPIVCLVMPYLPGKRGRGPMIDDMPYWDAVIHISILWILALIAVTIWSRFKSRKQFGKIRKFLKKNTLIGEVTSKSSGLFESYENRIQTNIAGDFGSIKVEKEQSKKLNVGDKIEVEFEEHTKTVLSIKKI